ncbi:hypothetical protein N2152v2_008653 [Parachlorella kessleri]
MAGHGTGNVLASFAAIIQSAQQQLQSKHGNAALLPQQQGGVPSGAIGPGSSVPEQHGASTELECNSAQPSTTEQLSGEAGQLVDLALKAMAAGHGAAAQLQDIRAANQSAGVV